VKKVDYRIKNSMGIACKQCLKEGVPNDQALLKENLLMRKPNARLCWKHWTALKRAHKKPNQGG